MIVLHATKTTLGADQLHGYRVADLDLCFSHMQKNRFSHDVAYMVSDRVDIGLLFTLCCVS